METIVLGIFNLIRCPLLAGIIGLLLIFSVKQAVFCNMLKFRKEKQWLRE